MRTTRSQQRPVAEPCPAADRLCHNTAVLFISGYSMRGYPALLHTTGTCEGLLPRFPSHLRCFASRLNCPARQGSSFSFLRSRAGRYRQSHADCILCAPLLGVELTPPGQCCLTTGDADLRAGFTLARHSDRYPSTLCVSAADSSQVAVFRDPAVNRKPRISVFVHRFACLANRKPLCHFRAKGIGSADLSYNSRRSGFCRHRAKLNLHVGRIDDGYHGLFRLLCGVSVLDDTAEQVVCNAR